MRVSRNLALDGLAPPKSHKNMENQLVVLVQQALAAINYVASSADLMALKAPGWVL
jgi:hypothetical protein